MSNSKTFRTFALAVACALSMTVHAVADTPKTVNVVAGNLADALETLAKQFGVDVIYPSSQLKGLTTEGVNGTLDVREAFQQLVKGTALLVKEQNGSVLIAMPSGIEPVKPTAQAPEAGVMRLAQNDSSQNTESQKTENTANNPPLEPSAEGSENKEPETVVVTGSHIRGVRNETAPMVVLDRTYIERSGFSNTMQLVESLPQNFKGGDSGSSEEAIFGEGPARGQNLSRGTGLNLRGLGAVSTLTLINGRRVAPSAQGQFVDVSTIPITAIERVEVMTDGASAVYGADAVAGVVNIILRTDLNGSETSLQYGGSTQGGADERRLAQTYGSSWEGGHALIIGEYNHRHALDTTDRQFILDAGAPGRNYLLPDRELYSVVANIDQQLPGKFDVTSTLIFSNERVNSINTGIGALSSEGSTSIDTSTNQWSLAAGLGYEPAGDWRISLETSMAKSLPTSDVGVIDLLTGVNAPQYRDFIKNFKTSEVDLKGDGTLFQLPAGALRIATGVSYRKDEFFSSRYTIRISGPVYSVRFADERDVKSAFAEMYVPLVSETQDFAWARKVALSLAGRYDRYSDFGSTTNPRYGLVWSPSESLDLRVAYSTSFRAPTEWEKSLGAGSQFLFSDTFDAPDGTPAAVPALILSGSAPLLPEESENISMGFTYRPVRGLELTLNYFDIDYRNRISTPPFDYGALSRQSDFGDLLSPFASGAAAQAFLDQRVAAGDVYLDFIGIGEDMSSVQYLFDWRQKNAARTRMSGLDLTTAYSFTRAADTFDLTLNIAHINDIETSLTAESTAFADLDHWQRPLNWRLRGMGTWTRGGLSASATLNYADSYINDSLFADERVGSWTTVDLHMNYAFHSAGMWLLSGSSVGLGIRNLTDEAPPAATDMLSFMGFDVANANALGRFITVEYSKQW